MAEMNEDLPSEVDEEHKCKIKQSPKSKESSVNNKLAKSLGNGRWKYHGKTYKEELLGKN